MRLDPLLVLSHLLASRTFLAGSALALIIIFVTLLFGRAWCGWLCPMGTTLDLISLHRLRGRQTRAERGLAAGEIYAAVGHRGGCGVRQPDPVVPRPIGDFAPHADGQPVARGKPGHQFAGGAPLSGAGPGRSHLVFRRLVETGDHALDPAYYRDSVLIAAFFLGVVALDLLASRFWCRYLCPLGGLLGLLSKLAVFRRSLKQECKGCTLCTDFVPPGPSTRPKAMPVIRVNAPCASIV